MPNKRKRTYTPQNIWDTLNFTDEDRINYQNIVNNSIARNGHGNAQEKHTWAHATSTKNYMLKDPCLDWLSLYLESKSRDVDFLVNNCKDDSLQKKIKPNEIVENNSLQKKIKPNKNITKLLKNDHDGLNILFHNGLIFEEKVFDEIKKLGDNINKDCTKPFHHTVYTNDDHNRQTCRSDMEVIKEKKQETLEYMRQGIPVIFQAVLMNNKNYTYGIADIIIRSDYINEIINKKIYYEDLDKNAPYLHINGDDKYHYRVIDIKWTTIELCSNGEYLRNSDWIPAYKAQLAIYTAALGQMQGYTPNHAYIMAKSWHVNSKDDEHGYSCFDRLGIIDYSSDFDNKYIEQTKKAVQWYHKISMIGSKWSYGPTKPDIPELYPNMCNTQKNGKYGAVKNKIAKSLEEITQVWYVNPTHRDTAHSKQVFRLSDPLCTTETLGIKPSERSRVIDNILNINRSSEIINPSVLKCPELENLLNKNRFHYYVDFEVLGGVFRSNIEDIDVRNTRKNDDMTFIIGIGFNTEDDIKTGDILLQLNKNSGIQHTVKDSWEFICFYAKKEEKEQEEILFANFITFVKLRTIEANKIIDHELEPKLIHWSPAEPAFLDSAKSRYKDNTELSDLLKYFSDKCIWTDLYQYFVKIPIIIKGCMNFKLKTIVKAMKQQNMINTEWPDNGISGGLQAMLAAVNIYKNNKNDKNDDIIHVEHFKDIVIYNEIDCKAMYDIVKYLKMKYM